ncbi:MAG: Coenzyme F420 hydrogenase/dehydrogenase, beta subunit C-terminal domain [Planctomycetota bacterium]|nr:Coenzyme F420 hydrogenase/dehydrogenase, beta subunit C-terminal domain [Planctomycetota bacterium]
MSSVVHSIRDVAERHLCCGCGVCAYLSPDDIRMIDVVEHGRRPLVRDGSDPRSHETTKVCPGIGLEQSDSPNVSAVMKDLLPAWGPILEVWEGYASDPELRFAGSSGGAASALALYCIEKAGMHGALHIASRPEAPYLNQTVLSTTRADLLARTGSRYAPASPCDGLSMIEQAPSECVFMGKPCDVAGARNAAAIRPGLGSRLALTIAVFCAGTPSTQGTLEMLKAMGIEDPASVADLRYRGNGWPGKATATVRSGAGTVELRELTYEQSWGEILQKHRQWRCYVCIDHSGEFADIAVGDPWYRTDRDDDPGRSLVLVRTERGRRVVREAIACGFIWWCRLTLRQKAQSLLGTIKRIRRKHLRQPAECEPYELRASCVSMPGRAEDSLVSRHV